MVAHKVTLCLLIKFLFFLEENLSFFSPEFPKSSNCPCMAHVLLHGSNVSPLRNPHFPSLQMGPPLYDVKDMKVPTAIWSGGVDCLADPRDVALLVPQVRNLVYHKVIPQWNHLDFLLGLDATEILYQEIVDMMKRHL